MLTRFRYNEGMMIKHPKEAPIMICSFSAHPRMPLDLDCCTHEDKICTYNGHKMCRDCFDTTKIAYDANYKAEQAEYAACPDCQAANAREYERSQRRDTLDPSRPYGEHIPLICFNHQDDPLLRWNTKNIAAGRSIFFNGWGQTAECDCPAHMLFSPGRFIYKLCYLLGTDNTKGLS